METRETCRANSDEPHLLTDILPDNFLVPRAHGNTCDVCGHDERHGPWPDPDMCPRCFPELQAEAPIPPRRPVPIASLPTKDRLLLQAILTLASELVLRFHPSEQVGWLNYFLEQLDVQHLAKFQRYTHANYVLQALRREISDRLEFGRW